MGSFVLEQGITTNDDDGELEREEAERNEEIMQLISAKLQPFSDDELDDSNASFEDSSSEAEASVTHRSNHFHNGGKHLVQEVNNWMEGNEKSGLQHKRVDKGNHFVSDSESQQLQYDQLEVLYKAQGRQIKQLQQQHEEGERKIRILNHQLATAHMTIEQKDKKCCETLEQLSIRDQHFHELQQNVKTFETQLDTLTVARDNALADLQLSETTIDTLQSQLNEMSRSETLGRARRQQEEAMAAIEKRHEQEKLALRLKSDQLNEALAMSHAETDRLKKEMETAVSHGNEERLRNGETINKLTASLQENQMRCQQLLEAGSSRQLTELKLQLQQATTAYQETQAQYDSLKLQAHDLEKQLQIALTDKQQLSDQLNDTMTQLNGHHQPSNYHNHVDPEVTHLKLDLHKATEENENKEHQIEELCSQLASLQKIIEGERSKNCEAEGRMKRLEAMEAHLKEARKQESELKETVARLTGELKKQAKKFEEDKKTSLEKCRQACLQLHNSSAERLRRTTDEQQQQQIATIRLQLSEMEAELKQSNQRYKELETTQAVREKELQKQMEDEKNKMRIEIQNKSELLLEKERQSLISDNTTTVAVARAELLREKDEQVKREVENALQVAESEWKIKQREEQRKTTETAVNECKTKWNQRLKEAESAAIKLKQDVERKMTIAAEETRRQHELAQSRLKSDLNTQHQQEIEKVRQECEAHTQQAVAAAQTELKQLYDTKTRRLQEAVAASKHERRKWEDEKSQMLEKQKRRDAAYRAAISQKCELPNQVTSPSRMETKSTSTQTSGEFEDDLRRCLKERYAHTLRCMKTDMMQHIERVQQAAQHHVEIRIARERQRILESMKK